MSILGFLRKFPWRIASEWPFQTCEGDLLLALTFQRIMVWASECKKCRNVVTMKTKRTTYFFPNNRFDVHFGKKWARHRGDKDCSARGIDPAIFGLHLFLAGLNFASWHVKACNPVRFFSFALWSEAWPAPVHFFVLLFLILPFIEFNHPSQNVLILNSFAIFLPLFSSCDFGVCSIFPFLVSTVLPAPLLAELAGWLPFLVSLPFPASTAFCVLRMPAMMSLACGVSLRTQTHFLSMYVDSILENERCILSPGTYSWCWYGWL